MSQPFIGQVIAVGFNFAPVGWALCNGQLLSISEYQALYTLIGTTYGGDGVNTFGLPNLQGHAALSQGTGAGLPTYVLGEVSGSESVTLTASQIGNHPHTLNASAQTGGTTTPGSTVALGQNPQPAVNAYSTSAPTTSLAQSSIGPSGGSQPHENRQPYLTINYIIALYGVYPSQG
jgi:microcystin-dependent protein